MAALRLENPAPLASGTRLPVIDELKGCAILLVSVELDEIMALSDRILVMCAGRIVGEVAGAQADEKSLGLMMANIGKEEAA